MKKALRETQTLRAGCSRPKAEPKIFAPPQTPFPGGAGRPKFNQLDTASEDRCTQFRATVITDPPTHKQTGPITIHCAAASAQCNNWQMAKHPHQPSPTSSVWRWQFEEFQVRVIVYSPGYRHWCRQGLTVVWLTPEVRGRKSHRETRCRVPR